MAMRVVNIDSTKPRVATRMWGLNALVLGIWLLAGLGCKHDQPANPEASVHSHPHSHQHSHARPASEHDHCVCQSIRFAGGWCAACQVGYVAGQLIHSAMVFDAIDGHGHDILPTSIECESCQNALPKHGYCDSCGYGFLNGQLYCSKLSWAFAHGTPTDRAAIRCSTCASNAATPRWCNDCDRGMVGSVAFTKPVDFQRAAQEYAVLEQAITISESCEYCAVAMVTGSPCPTHSAEHH